MNPSYDQLNDYTHYLESQVQKFTSFMLTQKKLNEKHLQLEQSIELFFSKINKIDQKIKLIELNQKDNLYELKKIKTQKQAFKNMQLRLENIQHQLSSILKIDSKNSFDHGSQQSSIQNKNSERKNSKKQPISSNIQETDLVYIEKYLSQIFAKRQDLEYAVNKKKEDLDFKIKKLQIQVDKSKESFLKLTSHINSLSTNVHYQNQNKKQAKQENGQFTQSTKDANMESLNHQNIVTKKQLKKMQKKLQNYFSEKFSELATKSQKQQAEFEGIKVEKAQKFKKMQQKYDRMTLEHSNPRQTRSQRKIDLSDRQYSSQKKIPLFDNEILKERHINQITQNDRKKRKSKSRSSNKDSPIGTMDLERYGKEKKSLNSRNQVKKIGKKRSLQRIKNVNADYMIQ